MCDDDFWLDNYTQPITLNDLDHARDHMGKILDILYKNDPVQELEYSLEEVLYVLGMKMPEGDLNIKKI